MAILVHLTDVRNLPSIRRSGLKAGRAGLHALPVTPDFMATHQWARELKRWRIKTPAAVYFRMPGVTPVLAGRYNEAHQEVSLATAIAAYLRLKQSAGYEIIFRDSIPRSRVIRIKALRRPVGWRFHPGAKGERPPSPYWTRGQYGAAKVRARLEPIRRVPMFQELKRIIETSRDREALSEALCDLASKRRRASCAFLEPLLNHPDAEVLLDLLSALKSFEDPLAADFMRRLAASEKRLVRDSARWELNYD